MKMLMSRKLSLLKNLSKVFNLLSRNKLKGIIQSQVFATSILSFFKYTWARYFFFIYKLFLHFPARIKERIFEKRNIPMLL